MNLQQLEIPPDFSLFISLLTRIFLPKNPENVLLCSSNSTENANPDYPGIFNSVVKMGGHVRLHPH